MSFGLKLWVIIKDALHRLRLSGFRGRVVVASLVLLHLAIVVPLAAILNIWDDEAITIRTTGGGIVYAVQRAVSYEFHPPLYDVLLTLWRTLGDSLFFARMFSIVCTAGTVALSGSIARCYIPGIPPALLASMVALNPLTIYTALDVRMYALVLFLCALLLVLFHQAYLASEPSSRARRWYIVTAILALYTQHYLGFILVAAGASLLFLQRFKELGKYVVGMLIVAAMFAPLAVITMQKIPVVVDVGVQPQTFVEAGVAIWRAAWGYFVPVHTEGPLVAIEIRRWLVRLAIVLVLLVNFMRFRRPSRNLLVLLTLAGVVGLFLVGIGTYLGPDFLQRHHTTVFLLPVLLAALALLQHTGGRVVAGVGAVVGLFFSVLYLIQNYSQLGIDGDWIRVSRYLQRYENTSEPILVFRPVYILYLGYHYAGRNLLIPLPRPMAMEGNLESNKLRDEGEIVGALSGRVNAGQRFWLVTTQTQAFRGIDIHPEILEHFIARRCRVLRDESFVGSRVRLLELRSEARLSRSPVGGVTEDPLEPRYEAQRW